MRAHQGQQEQEEGTGERTPSCRPSDTIAGQDQQNDLTPNAFHVEAG